MSLETKFEAFAVTQNDRHDETKARLDSIESSQKTLQEALARYTGFWGAIMLVGGVLATILTLFGDLLRKKLGWG